VPLRNYSLRTSLCMRVCPRLCTLCSTVRQPSADRRPVDHPRRPLLRSLPASSEWLTVTLTLTSLAVRCTAADAGRWDTQVCGARTPIRCNYDRWKGFAFCSPAILCSLRPCSLWGLSALRIILLHLFCDVCCFSKIHFRCCSTTTGLHLLPFPDSLLNHVFFPNSCAHDGQ